ncbi:MAG: hypothetical protein ACF8NJ_09725 [Phycisphaerales bacterium JB038]
MSNGTKQGSGLSAQCVGCLIIGLVIGLFAGAFLPTLFSGSNVSPPPRTSTPSTEPRTEGYEDLEAAGEEAVEEGMEELGEVVEDETGEELPGDPDAPGEGGDEGAGG